MMCGEGWEAKRCSEMTKLLALLESLPLRMRVEISREVDDETGQVWLGACVFLDPPEDGWATEGDYFQHIKGSPTYNVPCRESWKYSPCCLFGTVEGEMFETLVRDLPHYIEKYKETP